MTCHVTRAESHCCRSLLLLQCCVRSLLHCYSRFLLLLYYVSFASLVGFICCYIWSLSLLLKKKGKRKIYTHEAGRLKADASYIRSLLLL
jgi:hypothetical protein